MFDEQLSQRFAGLKVELDQALYRYYLLTRQRKRLIEDIVRIEAGLAEVERVQKDWEAQKAIDEAQAEQGEDNGRVSTTHGRDE